MLGGLKADSGSYQCISIDIDIIAKEQMLASKST